MIYQVIAFQNYSNNNEGFIIIYLTCKWWDIW
jgi:hypothetical protein